MQHLGPVSVAEPDVLPADVAVDPVELLRVRFVADLGLLVQTLMMLSSAATADRNVL